MKRKANKKLILFLILMLAVPALQDCRKDSLTDNLTGTWVRDDNAEQLVQFGIDGNKNWLSLTKGYVIDSDGNPRLVKFLGEYRLLDDSISIHWMHSSSTYAPKFYFSVRDSEFDAGDFIDGSDSIVHFVKYE